VRALELKKYTTLGSLMAAEISAPKIMNGPFENRNATAVTHTACRPLTV